MAFYTVRVDEAGNEVDRPRTSRKYDAPRTIEFSSARHTAADNGLLVRYVNPAAIIRKTQEPETCDQSLSGIVPPLDLNSSGETLPSENGNDIIYPVPKTFEVSKITKSDAFSNWLSAKKKLKSYEQARQREIELEKQRLIDEKKALAKQKYEEWLEKKANSKEKPKPEQKMQEFQVYHPNDDDNESNRRAWELNKQEELRRKKNEQLRAQRQEKLEKEKRKKEAAKAWENWLAVAPLKPKPVPLNQGIMTLKGTISDIFVNPNPWCDPCDVHECD